MKITITMDISDELADPGHSMGVTEEAYNELMDALGQFGQDIDVKSDGESDH